MALDKKKKLYIAIGIGLVTMAIAVYFLIIKPNQDAKDDTSTDAEVQPSNPLKKAMQSVVPSLKYNYTPFAGFDKISAVKHWDSGKEVKQLQSYFADKKMVNPVTKKVWTNTATDIDGNWGNGTEQTFLAAKFPIDNQPGKTYTVLTKSLYDKLGLSHYNV